MPFIGWDFVQTEIPLDAKLTNAILYDIIHSKINPDSL